MKFRMVLLLFVMTSAFAQTGTVRGRVTETGDSTYAVIGAYVKLLHGQRGASIRSLDGSYSFDSLTVGPDTLQIGAIGYFRITCPIFVKPDSITEAHFSLMQVPIGYADPGECGTPVHGYPPPENYDQTHSKIEYLPRHH